MKFSGLCKYFTNLSPSQENDIPEIQVTERGVLQLLQALNISKAAGPDDIRPIKSAQRTVLRTGPNLYFAFSGTYTPTIPPRHMENANVNPTYKEDDKTNPFNYRPVSLTCITCKLLEHIICSSLMQHLTRHNILYPLHYGFRENVVANPNL